MGWTQEQRVRVEVMVWMVRVFAGQVQRSMYVAGGYVSFVVIGRGEGDLLVRTVT